jgi:hypothetical protein
MDKKYTTAGERGMATRLVRAAIKAGYTVSVNDGEEWTVRRSTAEREILAALGSTELDYIRFYRGDDSVGTAMLIWGNDATGEELIADYTDKPDMESIVQQAYRAKA